MKRKVAEDLLDQHWVHSHEEDTNTEMVYRSATFNFPPSRGRKSFDLKPDGSLLIVGIGPTDRPQVIRGTWKLEGNDNLVFYTKPEHSSVMKIVSLDKDRLVTRK